jgi:putrescine transport system permease protein
LPRGRHNGVDPRHHCRNGDGAFWAFSRVERLCLYDHRAAGYAGRDHRLSLLLFVALAHAIGWPADRGMLTIWLAHVTFCTAYVAVVISSRLRELDRSIEEAAMDLGATPLKVFFIITLPMIMPAVISGWLLAFTLSLDDLVIASFVSGPGATTLPMLVFSSVRMGVNPEINALASIILGVVGIVGFIAWYLMARAEKQRVRDIQRARRG